MYGNGDLDARTNTSRSGVLLSDPSGDGGGRVGGVGWGGGTSSAAGGRGVPN